jgi:hypothetical protein
MIVWSEEQFRDGVDLNPQDFLLAVGKRSGYFHHLSAHIPGDGSRLRVRKYSRHIEVNYD